MAMVPGKAPTPPTVTLKHLAAALAETHEMSKKQAETVLSDLVGNIVNALKKGERIRIGGLGMLQVRKRAARIGRNPATGEQIQIKASKKVAFRASKELKESIDDFCPTLREATAGVEQSLFACRFFLCRICALASDRRRAILGGRWAVSSVGRAPALHAGCRRLESVTAHHAPACAMSPARHVSPESATPRA